MAALASLHRQPVVAHSPSAQRVEVLETYTG